MEILFNLSDKIPETSEILVLVNGKEYEGYYSNSNKCLMRLKKTVLTSKCGVRSTWTPAGSKIWKYKYAGNIQ